MIDYEGFPYINVGDVLDDTFTKLNGIPNNFVQFKNRSTDYETNHSQYQDRIEFWLVFI